MNTGAVIGFAAVIMAGIVTASVLLGHIIFRLAGVVGLLADVVLRQAGVPTEDQREEISRQLARLAGRR